MGVVTGTILLRNARVPTMVLQVGAIADTRTVHLCIPEAVHCRTSMISAYPFFPKGEPCPIRPPRPLAVTPSRAQRQCRPFFKS